MSKKLSIHLNEATHKGSHAKKNEANAVSPKEFWDKFVKDEATDLLEAYEMNDTQGGDGWEGHDVEEISNISSYDGSPRESFNAGLQKDFVGNLGFFESSGYHDGQLSYEIEKAQDAADSQYAMDVGPIPDEDSEGYEDYLDYVSEFLQNMNLWGVAVIELRERAFRGVDYTLTASLGREYDGGDTIGDSLYITMDLSTSQLTQANAAKFLAEVKKQFETYSFSEGDKEISVEAD